MEILAKIGAFILAPIMALGGFFTNDKAIDPVVIKETTLVQENYDASYLLNQISILTRKVEDLQNEDLELGAQTAVGGKRYFLSGGGVSASQTTIDLTNFDIAGSKTDLIMTHFGTLGCGTLEPGHTTRQEFISFTGITQNADDTAQLTGVSRGLLPIPDYTASTTFESAHSGGSTFVVSNSPPCFYEDYASLSQNETVTGSWTAITPTAASGIAIKSYVDSVVTGGAITLDGIAVGATAGETFATGTIVFFDNAQDEWMKASALVSASSTRVQLGVAQGSGINGAVISGGVITRGLDKTQKNGTVGQTIFLSDTAGATSTSAGTIRVVLGEMKSATEFYFNPDFQNYAGLSYANTFTDTSTFTGTTTFSGEALEVGVNNMIAGETINGATLPVPVYLSDSDNEVYPVDGNATNTQKYIGFAVTNATNGNPIRVQTSGIVSGFSSLTVGDEYYVSDTAGEIASTTGTFAIPVGITMSATEILIQKGKRHEVGSATLGTVTNNNVILTGFRPSVIRIFATAVETAGIAKMDAIWRDDSITGVGARMNASGADLDLLPRIRDISGGSNYFTFSITSVTDIGFTITETETGTYDDGGRYVWEAEGEF